MGSFVVSRVLQFLFDLFVHGKIGEPQEEFAKEKVKKILVVRNDNIGDVICSTPAIQALRENFPGAYLAVLVASYSREAIEGNPHVDEIFVYDKYKHGKYRSRWVAWWKQYQVLRSVKKKRFDLAIGLRPDFSFPQGWIVYFSGAKFRLGTYPKKKKHEKVRFFYNLVLQKDKEKSHAVERNLEMLEVIGVTTKHIQLTVDIPEEEKKIADDFLRQNNLADKLCIGFFISSRLEKNNLREERFTELADRLIEKYKAEIILTYAPWEKERAEGISRLSKNRIHLFPTKTLKSLGSIQERCSLFISVDGGPMHLAAAVGVPTIALFGKTGPQGWRPWGEGNIAMKKEDDVNSIAIEDILTEVDRILKKRNPA